MGISLADIPPSATLTVMSSPEAIRACIASLAAEAFDAGHSRAAQVLAHTAALLNQSDLWARTPSK